MRVIPLPQGVLTDCLSTRISPPGTCSGLGTGVEQEMGNVEKCLAAGFSQVALISLRKMLARVQSALAGRLSKEENERELYLSPEELASLLDSLPSAETTEGRRLQGEGLLPADGCGRGRGEAACRLEGDREELETVEEIRSFV
jgi:hypothetical protein